MVKRDMILYNKGESKILAAVMVVAEWSACLHTHLLLREIGFQEGTAIYWAQRWCGHIFFS